MFCEFQGNILLKQKRFACFQGNISFHESASLVLDSRFRRNGGTVRFINNLPLTTLIWNNEMANYKNFIAFIDYIVYFSNNILKQVKSLLCVIIILISIE
jgi:hypothetical protein